MKAVPLYRVELHSHCHGDPIDTHLHHTLFEHIDQAKKAGLDAIAITWHCKVCSDPEAFAYAREKNILLIPGMEADIDKRHLVLLDLEEGDLPGKPTWEQIRELRQRKPEVFVLAPHPFYPHWSCLGGALLNQYADCIDAVEWCMLHVHWIPPRISPNLRAAHWAHQHGKPVVACSDAHALNMIGRNASMVDAEELTAKSILRAIRAGRVTFHRKSLEFRQLAHQTQRVLASQPRYMGRWVAAKLTGQPAP